MIQTSNELPVNSAGVYGGVIWDILGGPDWEIEHVIQHAERCAHYQRLNLL